MSEEELEETGIMQKMINNVDEEEMTIDEMIEEFLEKLDFMDIDKKKQDKLKKLCSEVQKEKDDKAKEYLFKLLKKEANKK